MHAHVSAKLLGEFFKCLSRTKVRGRLESYFEIKFHLVNVDSVVERPDRLEVVLHSLLELFWHLRKTMGLSQRRMSCCLVNSSDQSNIHRLSVNSAEVEGRKQHAERLWSYQMLHN